MTAASVNLVVLAGAGASYGVSKEKFPTTQAFYERHVKSSKLIKNDLFLILDGFVRHNKQKTLPPGQSGEVTEVTVDIEEILVAAQELRDVLVQFRDSSESVVRYAIQHGNFERYGLRGAALSNPLVNAASELTSLIQEIDLIVHNAYGIKPTAGELDNTWVPILKQIDAAAQFVDIFTTNYDLVLEK